MVAGISRGARTQAAAVLHFTIRVHHNSLAAAAVLSRAALAGLRVGYGSFPLDMIEFLWRAKQPYNVSVASEVAACAALTNPGYLETVRNALVSERDRLFSLLKEVPFLEPYPSHANFILCKVRAFYRTGRAGFQEEEDPCVCSDLPPSPLRPFCFHLNNHTQVKEGRDAKGLKDALANQGIMVRHYAKKELSGFIRISVGKPEHTDALMAVIRRL